MMKKFSTPLVIALAATMVAVILLAKAPAAEAVTCNPTELTSCVPAITGSAKPTPTCCSKLKQQKPCLCGYLKNPSLKQYVGSPGAKRVVSSCGVALPRC